jgi:hypothetical protein
MGSLVGPSRIAPATICRIKNATAMATSSVFSLGMPNPADDLPADDPPRDGSSLADMAAALDRRFQFAGLAPVNRRDQVLVLPENALRLTTSRVMQRGEQRRDQPSSPRQADDDGC